MRTRFVALGGSVLIALSGCSDGDPRPKALPPAQVVHPAAASAGGACILWDFAEIEQRLGVRFNVAAAGQVDDTSTCVLQADGASRPDLMLAVVEQTPADPELYHSELMPAGATKVTGLGRAAYRTVTDAAADHGPVVEVGWLTRDSQLMTLRFTFGVDARTAEAEAMSARLLALAERMAADDA
ncbi:MAG TPA: hypothetical protein VFO77_15705 [Actinoplanes sp.]|nr:hypothetical protein [Actinoplanes sp.]